MSEQSTKKVLLINNAYPTELFPKRGNYVWTIEQRLIAADLDVERIVLDSRYTTRAQKLSSYLKFYVKLSSFKAYDNYDYVYIHHFPNVFIGLMGKLGKMKNVVINFHGGDIVPTGGFAKLMNSIAYRFLSPKYSYIVPSEYFRKQVIRRIPKLGSSKFHVSPSGGIDTTLFSAHYKTKSNLGKPLHIGFASGIDYNKGVEELLRLMEMYKTNDYQFHIIDYGKHRQKYISKIISKANVVVHKTFKKVDMPYFYALIDVLFFPTKSESLGLVALEAMSCNVPVIGPDDFALKEIIVSNVSGEKYDPSITEDYVAAFDRFMANQEVYSPKKLIQKSFSKEYVVQQFKEIFV
ncbi:glycosyltransferase family 4 protein [Flagellimonas meishanensis]|uniref:glycosyltransferase family 4 protein n=1 Tax=Flagellimonas meishanensis TaxID=2873264 RepID=UPI001CA74361|nr:glycosyltransferase family 4 protein [[Muricauda] meishanensis]